jgi:hypothetical protein
MRSLSATVGYRERLIESKYFSFTAEGAAQYAKAAFGKFPQEGPYTLTRGVIRSDAIPAESRIDNLVDGGGEIDAFALWEDPMGTVGRVRIMPSNTYAERHRDVA